MDKRNEMYENEKENGWVTRVFTKWMFGKATKNPNRKNLCSEIL